MLKNNFNKLITYIKKHKLKSFLIVVGSFLVIQISWFLFFLIIATVFVIKYLKNSNTDWNKKISLGLEPNETVENTQTKESVRYCPHCKEAVKKDATKCPHCRSSITQINNITVGSLVVFILFIIVSVILIRNINKARQEVNETVTQNIEIKSGSEEDNIKNLVYKQLEGNNNLQKPYLRNVSVIKQTNGGWNVSIDYNASDNFTTNLKKAGIETTMSKIYTALYTSNKDIRSVDISAYFPALDKYGNEEDVIVYKSILNKTEAQKINWNADSLSLELHIIPGIWTTSILHQEFK